MIDLSSRWILLYPISWLIDPSLKPQVPRDLRHVFGLLSSPCLPLIVPSSIYTMMVLSYEVAIGLLFACASFLVVRALTATRRTERLPPGPPGKVILGNALDIPKESSWLYYSELQKKYGKLYTLMVVINRLTFNNR